LERLIDGFDEYLAEIEDEEREKREKGEEREVTFFCGRRGAVVIQLCQSYRAHPAILKSYSELFYAGRLLSVANPAVTHSLLSWSELPNSTVPILVRHTEGEEDREADSPSWFNQTELEEVMNVIVSLKGEFPEILSNEEIGVITPYRKQVTKLRMFLHSKGPSFRGIKVGVTEEFQGREKRVIIISTVRSMKENLKYDARFKLGFLRNPRRLNVAISRARALLVVIGNAALLSNDPYWMKFFAYCNEMQCYVGPDIFSPSTEDSEGSPSDEEFEGAFSDDFSGDENQYGINVDSPWQLEDK